MSRRTFSFIDSGSLQPPPELELPVISSNEDDPESSIINSEREKDETDEEEEVKENSPLLPLRPSSPAATNKPYKVSYS